MILKVEIISSVVFHERKNIMFYEKKFKLTKKIILLIMCFVTEFLFTILLLTNSSKIIVFP